MVFVFANFKIIPFMATLGDSNNIASLFPPKPHFTHLSFCTFICFHVGERFIVYKLDIHFCLNVKKGICCSEVVFLLFKE